MASGLGFPDGADMLEPGQRNIDACNQVAQVVVTPGIGLAPGAILVFEAGLAQPVTFPPNQARTPGWNFACITW